MGGSAVAGTASSGGGVGDWGGGIEEGAAGEAVKFDRDCDGSAAIAASAASAASAGDGWVGVAVDRLCPERMGRRMLVDGCGCVRGRGRRRCGWLGVTRTAWGARRCRERVAAAV